MGQEITVMQSFNTLFFECLWQFKLFSNKSFSTCTTAQQLKLNFKGRQNASMNTMGKSGRSRRSTKSKPKTTVTFVSWVNERLGTFEFIENESTTKTLLRVAKSWMHPDARQFFYYAERLCRGSKRITTRLVYSNYLLQEVRLANSRKYSNLVPSFDAVT